MKKILLILVLVAATGSVAGVSSSLKARLHPLPQVCAALYSTQRAATGSIKAMSKKPPKSWCPDPLDPRTVHREKVTARPHPVRLPAPEISCLPYPTVPITPQAPKIPPPPKYVLTPQELQELRHHLYQRLIDLYREMTQQGLDIPVKCPILD